MSAEAEQNTKLRKERKRNIWAKKISKLNSLVIKKTVGLKNNAVTSPSSCDTENTKHDLSKSFAKKKIVIKSIGLKKDGVGNPEKENAKSQSRSPTASNMFYYNKLKENKLKESNRILKKNQILEVSKLDKNEDDNNLKQEQGYVQSNASDLHFCSNARDEKKCATIDEEENILENEQLDHLIHEETKEHEATESKCYDDYSGVKDVEPLSTYNKVITCDIPTDEEDDTDDDKKEKILLHSLNHKDVREDNKTDNNEVNENVSEKDCVYYPRDASLPSHEDVKEESNSDGKKVNESYFNMEIANYPRETPDLEIDNETISSTDNVNIPEGTCAHGKRDISHFQSDDSEENKRTGYDSEECIKKSPFDHEEFKMILGTDVKQCDDGMSECFLERSEVDSESNTSYIKTDDITDKYGGVPNVNDYRENSEQAKDVILKSINLEQLQADKELETSDMTGDDIAIKHDRDLKFSDSKEISKEPIENGKIMSSFPKGAKDDTEDSEKVNVSQLHAVNSPEVDKNIITLETAGKVSLQQVLDLSSLEINDNSEKENLDLLRVLDDVNLQLKTQIDKLRKKEKQHELLDCSHSEKKVNHDSSESSKLDYEETVVVPKISESKANANENEYNIEEQQIAVQCITSTVIGGNNNRNRDNTNNDEENSVQGKTKLPFYSPVGSSHSEKKVNQDSSESSKLDCKKTTVAPKISESKANAKESEKCNIEEQQIAVQCITSTVKRGDNHSNRDNTNNDEENSVQGKTKLPFYSLFFSSHSERKVNHDLLESSKLGCKKTTLAPKISENKANAKESEKCNIEEQQIAVQCITSTVKRGDNHRNRDNTNNDEENSVEGGGSLPYYCPLEKKVNQDLLESSKSYYEETTVAPKISESKENIEENEKYNLDQDQVINKCIRSTAKCEDDNIKRSDNKNQKEKNVDGGSQLHNYWKKRDTNNAEKKNENEKSIFKLWEGRTNGWAKPQSKLMSMKQLLEQDINNNADVKADVVSDSINCLTNENNDNICDIKSDKVASNIPINECDGGNVDTIVVGEEDMKQPDEYDVNDNIGVKVDVISSSIDNHTKDDNDNICDTEIDKVTPNIPINEYDGDNIDTKVIGEEDIKQPVEHDINNNIDVKADAVCSSIDNHTKDDNDNICDIEVQDSTSNVPINECDGDSTINNSRCSM